MYNLLGVVLTGLEEVFSRTTMVQRDTWFDVIVQGRDTGPSNALTIAWQKKTWAASSATEMHLVGFDVGRFDREEGLL